jgi:hypothetical protein
MLSKSRTTHNRCARVAHVCDVFMCLCVVTRLVRRVGVGELGAASDATDVVETRVWTEPARRRRVPAEPFCEHLADEACRRHVGHVLAHDGHHTQPAVVQGLVSEAHIRARRELIEEFLRAVFEAHGTRAEDLERAAERAVEGAPWHPHNPVAHSARRVERMEAVREQRHEDSEVRSHKEHGLKELGAVVGATGIVELVRASELLAMERSPRLMLQDQPVDRVPTRKLRWVGGNQS